MKQRLVVVGNGMVGQRFVDELVGRNGTGLWEVLVIGDEPVGAYDRVALSSYFDGATADDLNLCDRPELEAAGVEFRFGTRVLGIDRDARTLHLRGDSTAVPYDHLVLATGSAPFVPPIPGHDGPGCFVYRTLDDLERIRSWSRKGTTGVVVGGGLLGLEAANALVNLGLDTHVVEMAPRLMPQQLDDDAAAMLQRWIEPLGVNVHLSFATAAIESDGLNVTGLREQNGTRVPADIVVFSAGIRPADGLARDAGLEMGDRGGVLVADDLSTSDPAISAIGEVACHRGFVYGLVAPGYSMARALANRLTGGDEERFEGADLSTKLKLFGVEMASLGPGPAPLLGDAATTTAGSTADIVFSDPVARVHRRLTIADDRIASGVLVGDISGFDAMRAMAVGDLAVPEQAGALVLPASAGTRQDIELPASSQICSCNAVTRGAVIESVAAGCHDVGAVRVATRAGTGCGGCVPEVQVLIREELHKAGVEVTEQLCEHFPHTRQHLLDLVRLRGVRTWSAVLAAFGSGLGCEICRPAVASILASTGSEYILDGDHGAIQDTNDHALANMQRNGTYSVVPRVPGGEITPAQLIALGEIAADHELYTKVTGAQRIDLFGAQLHELPEIWARVRAAGMESGHAYGKALRTVKSCVGSTWCRYGVQDSVAMAIRLELRYRGLRAPHKLKSAVSGCTRECAEAQSKDFGVIATESGWNLYIAGNGGRTPRHGDLLATDLTDDELITAIDRFLMYYIRTADRLERTSVWFEKLEGGVDHVRSVIFDDVLGACDEFDAEMERHVAGYECEWAATLDHPERLAHFVEFVNAPDDAWTPVWIQERGQRIPALG